MRPVLGEHADEVMQIHARIPFSGRRIAPHRGKSAETNVDEPFIRADYMP